MDTTLLVTNSLTDTKRRFKRFSWYFESWNRNANKYDINYFMYILFYCIGTLKEIKIVLTVTLWFIWQYDFLASTEPKIESQHDTTQIIPFYKWKLKKPKNTYIENPRQSFGPRILNDVESWTHTLSARCCNRPSPGMGITKRFNLKKTNEFRKPTLSILIYYYISLDFFTHSRMPILPISF